MHERDFGQLCPYEFAFMRRGRNSSLKGCRQEQCVAVRHWRTNSQQTTAGLSKSFVCEPLEANTGMQRVKPFTNRFHIGFKWQVLCERALPSAGRFPGPKSGSHAHVFRSFSSVVHLRTAITDSDRFLFKEKCKNPNNFSGID